MSDETTPDAPDAPDAPARPALRIVRGNPDDVDIAVITAVLSAAGGGEPDTTPPARDLWAAPESRLRPAWTAGPTGFVNAYWSH